MKVTITVENGEQDVEVARTRADVVSGYAPNTPLGGSLAAVFDLAVADARRACELPAGNGRCGKTMPHLQGDLPTHCALTAGHDGWHRDDHGQEAGVGW